MMTILTAAPSVLTLLLCAGLSYGQGNSPPLPKQATVILSTNGKMPAVLATPGNGSTPAPAENEAAPGK